jgi:hypothetical protein
MLLIACYARPVTDEGFELLTEITGIETIAVGGSIRDLRRLVESYGDFKIKRYLD